MKRKSFIQRNGLIAVWSTAGVIASGYIAFLILVGGQQRGTERRMALATNSPTAVDSASSKPIQTEVADLRAHVDELKDQEQRLAAKLLKIEEALGPITASITSAKPSGYGIDEEPPASTNADEAATSANILVKMSPLPQDDAIAEVYSRGGFDAYGISLATARTIDALERHWNHLQKTIAVSLADIKPRYINKGSAEHPLFELIAGPLDRMSEATSRCEQLDKVGIDCESTRFDTMSETRILNAAQGSRP